MSGDAKLRSEQILEHLEWVRRLARGLVVDASAADDVAQEAWVAALSRPWPGSGPARAWLTRVVSNAAKRLGRREGVRRGHEGDAARSEGLPSTEEILRRASLQRRLVDAVFELREPYRRAILLRYFEGLAPEAIAARLDEPVATVKTQLRRGLELLRGRLDDEHGDRGTWLLALSPSVRNSGPLAAGTGASIVSIKLVVGAVAAAGTVLVVGLWRSGRGLEPDAEADAVNRSAAVELATSGPSVAELRATLSGERVDAEPRVEPVRETSNVDPPALEPRAPEIEPSVLALALDDALASFRTDTPRVDDLRYALAELGRSAGVEPGSVGVNEDGVLCGSLHLPIPGVRGAFQRAKDRWVVDLTLGASPYDHGGEFPLRTISLLIPDDLAACQTAVQHHPDPRRGAKELLASAKLLTVGWTMTTSAEAGTKLDPIQMQPGPDGAGFMIGRLPDRPVEERARDADRSCYQPWADLLRPQVR